MKSATRAGTSRHAKMAAPSRSVFRLGGFWTPSHAISRSNTSTRSSNSCTIRLALRVRALAGNPADTREYRLALAAQLDARHAAPPTRALASEPEWIALRAAILAALAPFADARQAVADAIGEPG